MEKYDTQQLVTQLKEVDDDLRKAYELKQKFDETVEQLADTQDKLKRMSLRLGRQIGVVHSDVRKAGKNNNLNLDTQDQEDIHGAIHTLSRRCSMLRDTQLQTRSFFLRLVLGRVNVRVFSEREKTRLRDEYNKFKLRATLIFVLFPCVVLISHYFLRHAWSDTHWINVFYNLWVLYYFVSLAIRENILWVNGSNIRPWWIYHHYISALVAIDVLVWPATELYEFYVPYVTCFCCYMGVTQGLQILFYKKRDYTNRALGKTGHMDVSYPETITELPKELLVLIPFLMVGYVWQISLGVSCLFTLFFDCEVFSLHWTQYREELQIGFLGLFLIFLGMGNFVSLLFTIYSKVTQVRETKVQQEECKSLERVLELHQTRKDD